MNDTDLRTLVHLGELIKSYTDRLEYFRQLDWRSEEEKNRFNFQALQSLYTRLIRMESLTFKQIKEIENDVTLRN